jgi:hypothetical protein
MTFLSIDIVLILKKVFEENQYTLIDKMMFAESHILHIYVLFFRNLDIGFPFYFLGN